MSESALKSLELFKFDSVIRAQFPVIVGIDEAGRGPLAGDVFAAAVIFPEGVQINGLNDSKKLTEKKRCYLFDEIREKAIAYAIATASVSEIEEMNILNAAMLAMERAFNGLEANADIVLVDGNKAPEIEGNVKTIVKGDATSASIAAASILAKVARDNYAVRLDYEYPEYGFAKHKGYGTALHIEMLKKYGPCPVHRMSFLKKILGESKQND